MNTLDFCKFYVEKGWNVFPLQPHGKFPAIPAAHEKGNPCKGECGKDGHGLHDATIDLPKIAEWIKKYPGCNIGIATGQKSGFFVLDIDAGHGGEKTLSGLIEKYGTLPQTPISNTGGGGRHILFSSIGNDVHNTAGRIGFGIDTRGDGGYICAPNSIHPSGRVYAWDQHCAPSKVEISQAPDWLLFMLAEEKQSSPIQINPDGCYISGQRNNALTSMAGSMRRRGMNEESIFLALNAENLNKCVPPLLESEVRSIAASVIRYSPQVAPVVQNRDRIAAEWGFAKCLFESPDEAQDYQIILPEFLATDSIRDFWISLLSGIDPTTSATNAGILSELEHYQDWFMPRLEGYVKQIQEFGRSDRIIKLSNNLTHAAQSHDWPEVDKAVTEINRGSIITTTRGEHISAAWDEFENEVNERAADPRPVWGIPYAWNYLSLLTGGKQKGELILFSGEPKVGKSWWCLQDALETAKAGLSVFYWSGEMPRRQIVRRLSALEGLDSRRSKSGYMTESDWNIMKDAKAILYNIPFQIDDKPLRLSELRPMLKQKQDQFGIVHFVIDYAMKIMAPGKDEIEKTANISNEVKSICNDLNLSGLLIASVNKTGMDSVREDVTKSSIRGSGQQVHDADVLFAFTKFNSSKNKDMRIRPDDYDRTRMLHVLDGRELHKDLPGGFISYQREMNSPKFIELKNEDETIPNWLQREIE